MSGKLRLGIGKPVVDEKVKPGKTPSWLEL